MPIYEYTCVKCGTVEIFHGINESHKTECPVCFSTITKLISIPAAVIIKGRAVNQYNDCKGARTWRDVNGNLHTVTGADGHKKSATASTKKKRSDAEIEGMKRRDETVRKRKRTAESYKRFEADVKKSRK